MTPFHCSTNTKGAKTELFYFLCVYSDRLEEHGEDEDTEEDAGGIPEKTFQDPTGFTRIGHFLILSVFFRDLSFAEADRQISGLKIIRFLLI